jgi:DNA (cytosine-5)-methyltransferase 1
VRYLSVCSGIEAATIAWHPLGWTPVAFSEIDKFPCAVLKHHYPDVPNYGDMTKFQEWPDADVDVLVGGTPCQSFSVAGLRAGLDDPRGSLMLTYLAVARRYRPTWLVWENVPGVLSSDDGRAFGSLLGGLAELGYGFAYRVLDAQFVRVESHPRAVPQRRRRVFVVGHSGDWRRAAAVLFERESMSGHPAPRREAGQTAPTVPSRSSAGGGLGTDFDCDGGLIPERARALTSSNQRIDYETETLIAQSLLGKSNSSHDATKETYIAHALKADGFDASEDGTGRWTPLVPITLAIRGRGDSHDLEYRQAGTANAVLTPNGGRGGIGVGAVAFDARQSDVLQYGDRTGPLDTDGHSMAIQSAMQVRRLTPRECERLQGFPDDYTLIPYRGKPAADGPRYKALGNSMATNVMRWLGERIALVESLDAIGGTLARMTPTETPVASQKDVI